MKDILKRNETYLIDGCDVNITRKLGEGGYKTVYAADVLFPGDLKATRQAIAINHRSHPNFCREAEVLEGSRLKGANIMDGPYELVDKKGHAHLVAMGDVVQGQSLDALMRTTNSLPTDKTAEVMGQVARSLHSAHRDGFVHLDIKPENVMCSTNGDCTLIDWGMVQKQGFKTPLIIGTPAFISPEMASLDSKTVDSKMDVYSAGLMMEELANGKIRDRCDPKLNFDISDQQWQGYDEMSKNRGQSTTRDPLLSLTMQRATEFDPFKRGTALDMMTDLSAFPEARKHYDAEDRSEIVSNLVERTKDLNRRRPVLDAAAARGMLADLPIDHPKRMQLEAIEKLAPPPQTISPQQIKAIMRSSQATIDYEMNPPSRSMKA